MKLLEQNEMYSLHFIAQVIEVVSYLPQKLNFSDVERDLVALLALADVRRDKKVDSWACGMDFLNTIIKLFEC